jgi:hypothetical protein
MCPVGYSWHLLPALNWPRPSPLASAPPGPSRARRRAGHGLSPPVSPAQWRACGVDRRPAGVLSPARASGGRMEAKTAADGQARAVRCFGGVIHRPRRSGFAGGPVVLRGEGAKSVSFPCSPAGPARASRLARGMFARRGVCPSPAPSPARWRPACARCWRLASRV